jgi:hypothetical protein
MMRVANGEYEEEEAKKGTYQGPLFCLKGRHFPIIRAEIGIPASELAREIQFPNQLETNRKSTGINPALPELNHPILA